MKQEFTSRLTRGERIAALVYFPLHILALPYVLNLVFLLLHRWSDDSLLNLVYYVIGALYMLLFLGRFLRRDFDTLCDGFFNCLIQVCVCYGLMLLMNIAVNSLLSLAFPVENPNNEAIVDMMGRDLGKIAAAAVFLAPIVEELLFRAGIFSLIRNRTAAYAVSILLFSVYHIWGYALSDWHLWIYMVQYFPAAYLLCRCYERTNTIWGSIFLHMTINGMSMWALTILDGMV